MTVPVGWIPLEGAGTSWLLGVAVASAASLVALLLCPRRARGRSDRIRTRRQAP